eukprot:SAG11_NODE_8235_length_1043_cov_0.885593_1_plen_102_part_10
MSASEAAAERRRRAFERHTALRRLRAVEIQRLVRGFQARRQWPALQISLLRYRCTQLEAELRAAQAPGVADDATVCGWLLHAERQLRSSRHGRAASEAEVVD